MQCSTGWLLSHTSTSKSALSNANTLLSQDSQCSQYWVKMGITEIHTRAGGSAEKSQGPDLQPPDTNKHLASTKKGGARLSPSH